jgi:hypothetical protein
MTGPIFNRPIRRATPWVRWVAQSNNPIRIMRCFHCCEKQVVDYGKGLAAACKDERAFARAHAQCAPPARERRPRIAAELAKAREALTEAQRSVDRWSHSLMCRRRNPVIVTQPRKVGAVHLVGCKCRECVTCVWPAQVQGEPVREAPSPFECTQANPCGSCAVCYR